jgi:hypothetical protein
MSVGIVSFPAEIRTEYLLKARQKLHHPRQLSYAVRIIRPAQKLLDLGWSLRNKMQSVHTFFTKHH